MSLSPALTDDLDTELVPNPADDKELLPKLLCGFKLLHQRNCFTGGPQAFVGGLLRPSVSAKCLFVQVVAPVDHPLEFRLYN